MNCSAQEKETLYKDLQLLSRLELESVFYVVHVLAEDHRNSEDQTCAESSS